MLKSLPKFLLAVCTFFVFQNLCGQTQETEPNNTAATANTLALNGSGKGIINPAGDVDWYKIKTTSDGQLTITLTSVSGRYLSYTLYDTAGNIPVNATVDYNNGTSSQATDGLAKGTYYLQIHCTNAGDTCSYIVSISLTPASVANDIEPDSNRATALTLAVNATTTGHVGYYYNNHRDTSDWYKITTAKDGLLNLYLTSENGSYTSMYLYDNNGTLQLNNVTYNNGTATLNTDGLAAGTYYVHVFCTNTNTDFAPYTLKDSLFTPAQANDNEPDSNRATAITLALNGSTTGHVGYYYNLHRDTTDWYKVTTNKDGVLNLYLTSNNGKYTSMYLYDNNGTTLINNVTYNNGTTTLSTDGLATGTYYIQIFCTNTNTDFAPYTLKDSLFTPAQANDNEPDSNRATALTLAVNATTTGHVGYYYNLHRDSTDWYKITLPQDGQLNLTLTSNNGRYTSLYLYDNNGTTQINNFTYNNGTNTLSTDGLAAGTYYIQVFCTNIGSDFAPYTLQDTLLKYNFTADTAAEPNGSPYLAKTLPANRVTTGHTGFYYNLVRDTSDWWKINYTGSGALQITLNFEPNIHDNGVKYFSYRIYSDTNASAISSADYISTSLPYVINLSSLPQQYYYIQLYVTNVNSEYESYSIADTFVQVNKAQISVNTSKTTLNSSSCGTDSITYNLSGSHSPYTVRLYKNGAAYDSSVTTQSTITFKGLSAGNYYATSYGDGATDSAYGKSATSTVEPPVPTGLSTTNIGVHTATLNWTKLTCANYYKVQYRVVGNSTWTVVNTTGDTSKLALTGLQPYTLYAWEVAAIDTTKGLTFTSAFSDSLTFRTLSDTAHIMLVFKGAGSACNSDTLKYKCTNSQPPYTVTLYRNGAAYGSPLSVADTAAFYNVPPGNYYATATGTGSGGSYGKSDTTQIVPPAPTGLDTSNITSSSATLHWNTVSCANYYTIQYRVSGTSTWMTVSTSKDSITVSDLLPMTTYVWHVSSSDSLNRQTVTSAYSDSSFFTTQGILPVTFISFNGVLQNNSVILNWSTATEINSKGFEVEKSFNGAGFTDIGFVKGAGNSFNINNYSYTDVKLASGSNYYRLKQIDLDGRFQYSSVIRLDFTKFDWAILGNTSTNNSWVQLQLNRSANVSVQIVSLNGNIIQTINKGNISAGTYSIPLNFSNASSGLYVVRLIADNQFYSKKIIR